MPEEWLIDGYNLLHDLQSKKDKSVRSLRRLIELAAGFASATGYLVRMVLDGHGDNEELEACKTDHFQAHYSGSDSADTVIERYLHDHRGPERRLVVVTNDRAIAQMARGFGSRVLGTGEFWEVLEAAQREARDVLFKNKVKAHGFNRPFDGKI